jgi:hypothetical protein
MTKEEANMYVQYIAESVAAYLQWGDPKSDNPLMPDVSVLQMGSTLLIADAEKGRGFKITVEVIA